MAKLFITLELTFIGKSLQPRKLFSNTPLFQALHHAFSTTFILSLTMNFKQHKEYGYWIGHITSLAWQIQSHVAFTGYRFWAFIILSSDVGIP